LLPVTRQAIRKHLRDRGVGAGVAPEFMAKRNSELIDILDGTPPDAERPEMGEKHVARAARAGTSIHVRAGVVTGRGVAACVRLRQSAEAVSSLTSWLLHVVSESVVISVPDKALALGARTDPGQHAPPPAFGSECDVGDVATRNAGVPCRAGAMPALGHAQRVGKATLAAWGCP
jgi:hypothetical protein